MGRILIASDKAVMRLVDYYEIPALLACCAFLCLENNVIRRFFKWANCTHDSDEPALICLKCSNFILDEWLAANNSTKDKHQIKTERVIGRTLGNIVR